MKLPGKITALLFVVACIVCFWLVPHINKAEEEYTRLYENVPGLPEHYNATVTGKAKTENQEHAPVTSDTAKESRKKYRVERIEPDLKKIKLETFSRIAHFEPRIEEMLIIDSLTVQNDSVKMAVANKDTIKVVQ